MTALDELLSPDNFPPCEPDRWPVALARLLARREAHCWLEVRPGEGR